MKLNNKGMSIIETILSFVLIMAMVTGMIVIVMNYRHKAALSIEKLELDTFKNTLTQAIQNDILTIGLKEINYDGECEILTDLDSCINLVFQDDSMRAFGVSKIDINNRDSIENKYLYYDGIKYDLNETLPDKIPEGRNLVDLQEIIIENQATFKKDGTTLEDGTMVDLYTIDVNVSHIDFEEDFGIHIVATNAKLDEQAQIEEPDTTDTNIKYLAETIIDENTLIETAPILTTSSNNTSDKSGLYKSTATNSGQPTYYFRGNVTNNYVSFAGFTWRVVRINEDRTVRLILQDGINSNFEYQFIANYQNARYMYYTNSGVKSTIENWYTTNLASYDSYIASGNYFCEQAKAAYNSDYALNSGASMTVYSNYTPNFKCVTDGNGKGIVNGKIALLTYDEVVFAGGYYGKANNNYYLYNNFNWWAMSPAGYINPVPYLWYIYTTGSITTRPSYVPNVVRPVINLKANTIVTGNGSSSSPYIVQ